jgi:hypothetical protein
MGQIIFLAVVIVLIRQPSDRQFDPTTARVLFYIAVAMLLSGIPVGYLLRAKMYGSGRTADGSVEPGAYVSGNIILLAMCEGISLLAIVGMLLSRSLTPFIWVVAAAVVVQLINFPTGALLRQT